GIGEGKVRYSKTGYGFTESNGKGKIRIERGRTGQCNRGDDGVYPYIACTAYAIQGQQGIVGRCVLQGAAVQHQVAADGNTIHIQVAVLHGIAEGERIGAGAAGVGSLL